MALKQYGVHFVLFPKQGIKIEVVVLNRVLKLRVLPQTRNFCPKKGQGFRPFAAHLYPNIGRVPPPSGLSIRGPNGVVALTVNFFQFRRLRVKL